jgi:hypothetical protein
VTESPNSAATPRIGPRRTLRRRVLGTAAFIPGVLLLAYAVASGAGLFSPGARPEPAPAPLELGGIEWTSLDIEPSSTGEGFTVGARVADDRLVGADADPSSPYVLWMLANGRFDDRPWTDSWADEDALGLSHDSNLALIPVGRGEARKGYVLPGHFTPSIDGEITYDRIPAGEYTLRALVLQEGGLWDGTIATRRIVVE